ncbi:sigma-70 family RNA polymerase sigma factor [Pseudomonas sp. TH49]|uniref:sigma-70 family RNA polymerase sigma factor n=1 Tax=Pseudomonas sp. TH49 TaxID=2796413 RepID=UPI001912D33A|nr:sigma-70 family RNA polymerase sigma factor [Pseudomonas sp. TH49]
MPADFPSAQSPRNQLLSLLYSDHHGWLQNWLRKKLGCSQRAADLAQDTFIRVLTLAEPERLQEPRAFLTTTAIRLLIDGERRRKLERVYLAVLAHESEDAAAISPEDFHQIIELLESIARLLEGLAEKPRRAFLLNRLDGWSHAEIAEHLGVSKSMIKQYIAQVMVHCYVALYGGAP